VLPCVSHYQAFGTLMNYEGRGQRFDGMHFSTPVHLAASEVLVALIKTAGVEDSIGGTEFHDVFDITPETGRALDACRVGDKGCVVRTSNRHVSSPLTTKSGREEGRLQRWDVFHVFGSETLSALSPAILERVPELYIEVNPEDAQSRNIIDGQTAEFAELGVVGPVRVTADVAPGIVAVPVNHTRAAVAPAEVNA
jgi:NADH dehydrogenase/NADH:ubiquinone oxidoreductase subunit G